METKEKRETTESELGIKTTETVRESEPNPEKPSAATEEPYEDTGEVQETVDAPEAAEETANEEAVEASTVPEVTETAETPTEETHQRRDTS